MLIDRNIPWESGRFSRGFFLCPEHAHSLLGTCLRDAWLLAEFPATLFNIVSPFSELRVYKICDRFVCFEGDSMTYKEFVDNRFDDYILIKMMGSFPFYIEKEICKNGERHADNKYHIADGMTSTYINFEMPDNGISAEVSSYPRFEITGCYNSPVYVMNVGEEGFDITVFGWDTIGMLSPGEVEPIYPPELAEETRKAFENIRLKEFLERKRMSQSEINSLLDGD